MSRLAKAQALGQALPVQFDVPVGKGTLILDGDGLVYESCATAAKLDTAVRRFKTKVLEWQFVTGCAEVRVHLTPKGCWKNGRSEVKSVKRYQDNRAGKAKPPLLEATRDAVAQPGVFDPDEGVTILRSMQWEADDGMMMDAYSITDAIVLSPDKDLRIVPCKWYDMHTGVTDVIKDRYGWVAYDENKGKVLGHGTAFFWAQMLMGDTADNVKGLEKLYGKLCGPAAAFRTLKDCKTEAEAANTVIDAFRFSAQNPLPEAHCLWLMRTPEDTAAGYIWSLPLSDENRAFVLDCFNSDWRLEPSDDEDVQGDGQAEQRAADTDVPPWEDLS